MSAQSKGVLWVVPLSGREQSQIPIAHHVPPERVARVDHNSDHPHSEKRCLTDAIFLWLWRALQSAQYDDWKRGAVFECISKVHTTPAHGLGYRTRLRVRALHAVVLCNALPEPYQGWYADYERHPECAAAVAVWWASTAVRGGKEHAQ